MVCAVGQGIVGKDWSGRQKVLTGTKEAPRRKGEDAGARAVADDGWDSLRWSFGGYFHQDWPVDAPDWPAVVTLFAKEEPPAHVADVTARLAYLLRTMADDELQRLVDDFGNWYVPEEPLRDWLSQVRAALEVELRPRMQPV